MEEREALAGVRILAAVANADGKLDPREREALLDAIRSFKTPVTPESLLAADVNLDEQIAAITSPLAKRAVYEAAVGMAMVDRRATEEEQKILDRLRAAFADSGPSLLGTVLERETRMAGGMPPALDPETRATKVKQLISVHAFKAGFFGLIPVPIFGDVLVLMTQRQTIEGVAWLYGHPLTRKESWALFGAVAGLAGAQAALHSLLKLVPVWGAAVSSASAFASTYALGQAVNHHFRNEGKVTAEELKSVFASAKKQGEEAHGQRKAEIATAAEARKPDLVELARAYERNEMTMEEYERKVDEILEREAK